MARKNNKNEKCNNPRPKASGSAIFKNVSIGLFFVMLFIFILLVIFKWQTIVDYFANIIGEQIPDFPDIPEVEMLF